MAHVCGALGDACLHFNETIDRCEVLCGYWWDAAERFESLSRVYYHSVLFLYLHSLLSPYDSV